ncbi:MAG: GrpB family protein [Bacillaceae bacterium]|nr:GrpB family protein [Bacillaceae bacterium]
MGSTDKRKVKVVPYNPDWKRMFEQEAQRLQTVLEPLLPRIHHIGSTAITGIRAKPIIDILVEVVDISRVDRYNRSMQQLGYEPKGAFGIAGRRFFIRGGNQRTHHVHIFQKGNPEIRRHVLFRDYLIAHPREAAEYSALKAELARKFPEEIEAYIEGKDGFIKKIDQQAEYWYQERKKRGDASDTSGKEDSC